MWDFAVLKQQPLVCCQQQQNHYTIQLHRPRMLEIHTKLVATKSTGGQVLLKRESPDVGHFKLLHPNHLVTS